MKKAIGMFAALMVALAMTGIAVAHWSEILTISGTVNTGELDAELSAERSWDTEPAEKDYSYIYCYVDGVDPHILHVVVENAYPCIDYYQIFDIHNTGTIPLHINDIDDSDADEELDVDVTLRGWFPLAVEGQPPMELPVQLHPCDTVYGIIHVHVDQSAEELSTYEFDVEITVDQWNYDPT